MTSPRDHMRARVSERRRAVAFVKDDPFGVEFAEIQLVAGEHLTASGVAIGTAPLPYRLDYELETRPGFTTARLASPAAARDGTANSISAVTTPS